MVMELRARAWHEHDMIFFTKKKKARTKKKGRRRCEQLRDDDGCRIL
jgi:hypothetical protein